MRHPYRSLSWLERWMQRQKAWLLSLTFEDHMLLFLLVIAFLLYLQLYLFS